MIVERVDRPGSETFSSAKAIGELLRNEVTRPDVRFFSPDETSSNKFDAVFAATNRAWQLPIQPWDKHLSPDGRAIDLLSENTLASLAMGYNLTGRQSWLASYEAFLPIITSQLNQYQKFLVQSRDVAWRPPVKSLNLLSTSVCWRQDHNGFSHQNPGLIADLLLRPSRTANCYFPLDDVAAAACFAHARDQHNVVNLLTFSKTDEPRWIDTHHAEYQLQNGGASICQFASNEQPDLILVGIGDLVSKEALYGLQLAQTLAPLKVHFINVAILSHHAIGPVEQPLSPDQFNDLFPDLPIIVNFHGYPDTLIPIFATYGRTAEIHGYEEHGSTTTPLDMLVQNHASRYDIALALLKTAAETGKLDSNQCAAATKRIEQTLASHTQYIIKHGTDREEDTKWQWQAPQLND
jgi:xylulose-5-phosphate/fructose-6-phosphate phosphoketolase